MLQAIRLCQPEWVIAENVRGIITMQDGLVFEQVCADLEASGYEVQPFIIPAVAVNAPHRRDRVWFVANRKSQHTGPGFRQSEKKQNWVKSGNQNSYDDTFNAGSFGCAGNGEPSERKQSRRPKAQPSPADTSFTKWEESWLEVATRLCSVDNGLPAEVGDFALSKAQHRKEQLKAYGNAIVPQVAMQILYAMKEAEDLYSTN